MPRSRARACNRGCPGCRPGLSSTPGLADPSGRGGTDLPAAVAERFGESFARADPELREDLAQVPFDGPGADEQLSTDLWVGQAVASQESDVLLLCGQVVTDLEATC